MPRGVQWSWRTAPTSRTTTHRRDRLDAQLFRQRRLGPLRAGLKTLRTRSKFARASCSRSSTPSAKRCGERSAWLTFVVIAQGHGVELAGTLAEIARHTLARRIPPLRPRTARSCWWKEAIACCRLPQDLSEKALRQLGGSRDVARQARYRRRHRRRAMGSEGSSRKR